MNSKLFKILKKSLKKRLQKFCIRVNYFESARKWADGDSKN